MNASSQTIYVIDTNILVDYTDIIPNGDDKTPKEPTIDLSEAHIVIPTAVIRELSSFKKEKSPRGKAARIALKRIRHIVEQSQHSMYEIYHLEAPIQLRNGRQLLSILPIHKNFTDCLPYHPSDEDMDGQIILATLSVIFLQRHLPIDGTASPTDIDKLPPPSTKIKLLTNDNGLATRASCRGIVTSRYGYKYPEPHTGRRNVVVPLNLFKSFWFDHSIALEDWQEALPEQLPLVANEFVIMELAPGTEYPYDYPEDSPCFQNIGRYDANEKAIVPLRYLGDFPTSIKNAGQAIYAEALANPQFAAVICTGPAGTGKTYMSTIYGYSACKNGYFINVAVVPCEDRGNLGAMPGDFTDKMDPYIRQFKNAIRNFLLQEDKDFRNDLETLRKFGPKIKGCNKENSSRRNARETSFDQDEMPIKTPIKNRLADRVDMIWNNWFSSIPIDQARGRDFSYELALYDEFQDQNIKQADTLIKRIGADGKIVIAGDVHQIHAPYLDLENNGITYAEQELFDNPLVARVHFTEDEVIRHPLVQAIAKRQKASQPATPSELPKT